MADHRDASRADAPRASRPRGGRPSKSAQDAQRAPRSAMHSKVSPARLAALEAVRLVRERDAFAQDIIAKRIDSSDLEPEDRAFATKLVLGAVSAQGTLDEIVDRALRSPSDVQPDVRDALRLGAYEIVFLDKSPHAAVDQGVELVRSIAPRAAGLANAVLRKIVMLKASFPFGAIQKRSRACMRFLHG